MDRTLNAILSEINTAVKKVSFGSSITAYGLCYQQLKDGKIFPLLNTGNGDGKIIHWKDTEKLRLYHRMLEEIDTEVKPDKGFGSNSHKTRTYFMRAVVLGTRKGLTTNAYEDNEEFAREVADIFPNFLTNKEIVEVLEIEVDKNIIYDQEFKGTKLQHLSLDGIAFAVDYTLKKNVCYPTITGWPVTSTVAQSERTIKAMLDEINLNIKTLSFGSLITTYGLCYQQLKDGKVIPILNTGNGDGKVIHWNDTEPMRIYHRILKPIETETKLDKGMGENPSRMRTYPMRLVALAKRSALTSAGYEDNHEFAKKIADSIPTTLTNKEVVIASKIQTDKLTVYDEEFSDVTLKHLSLDGLAFWIDYEIKANICFPTAVVPAQQATALTFSSVTTTSLVLNYTNGDGSGRIVVAKSGAAVDSNPVDGTVYSASNLFGTGSQIGTGNYVVAIGSGPHTITGLTASTTYHFRVYEYNG